MPRISILGVGVDDTRAEDLERAVIECVEQQKRKTFAYANVHAINIAQRNLKFRDFLNNADVVYCDGEGIRFAARILDAPPPPRTALTRWVWQLGALFQEEEISMFLLGGRSEIVATAARNLCARYPRLNLPGYHHGYFDKSGRENEEVIQLINTHKPNVLFVGFGIPDQEAWIEENLNRLEVNAIMPCGGMIDYLAGEVKVAPRWMSERGIEWLHRLLQDPRRLWRRYLLGNPMFVFRIFLQRLTEQKHS